MRGQGQGQTQSADTSSTGIALYREGSHARHPPPLSSEASCLEQACLLSQLKPATLLESHSRHIPCLPHLLNYRTTSTHRASPLQTPTEPHRKVRSHFWEKGMEPISGVQHSSGSLQEVGHTTKRKETHLQAMAWEVLQGADQASQGAHLRVLEEACWALPYLHSRKQSTIKATVFKPAGLRSC